MVRSRSVTEMGLIVCKTCNEIIDSVDTEKVTVYYGICKKEECRQGEAKKGEFDCE
ncbi:GapA-binding peptide SR1P [Ferviditalea candida]|uniref:GapA-binding peptide SR1P n=1 Tax=Ferviditalea candida TaxID=3108399 RepID=A0ABU5ZKD4_9BACL|nr:GapA-binding peptide SR1P [Paenibacillaceae bacterium T2]